MAARMCNLSTDLDIAGVNVRVLDYRWNVDEVVSDCQDAFVLCYRPEPVQVGLDAELADGTVQSFGQLMFFPARTELRTTPAKVGERMRNIECTFSYDWFQRIWPDSTRWDHDDLARCYDLRNFRIEQAMQRLGSEAAEPGFGSRLMVESITQVIALEIARHFEAGGVFHRVRTHEGQLSTGELDRIYGYVDSAANRCPTTAEISRKCGVSAAHLRRSFKRTTGGTLHQYVAGARLKKAQAILAETDLPLKDVAFRLGFANSSTFSSTFKRASGETPSGYRQRRRR